MHRKEMRTASLVIRDKQEWRYQRAPLANTPVGGPGREAGTEERSCAQGQAPPRLSELPEITPPQLRAPRHPASGQKLPDGESSNSHLRWRRILHHLQP